MIPALALAVAAPARAGDPPEAHAGEVRPEPSLPPVLSVFALVQVKATTENLASTNPFLDGQVVGELGGINGVVVDPATRATYTEERVSPFLTWAPRILSGKGSLTAAFEIDFAFGDQAYGVGGNTGGGFGADQVNLQTRRLHVDWFPSLPNHDLHVIAGLQFIADSVTDPTRTTPDGLFRSGGRLGLFGSEGAGVAVFGKVRDAWSTRLKYRLGTYTLLEQGRSLPDDVWLTMADAEVRPIDDTTVGVHAWYLQDRSGGTGGPSGLTIGPAGALWDLQGGPRLDPYDGAPPPDGATIDADLVWLGLDAGYNAGLDRGPIGATAGLFANFGKIYAPVVHDDPISGFTASAEGRVRYAAGEGSVARLLALVSTGDDADPQRYTGVVTGNAYGIVGAPMPANGALLLFADGGAVNRQVSIVPDLSGGGLGLLALSGGVGFDPVPSRLTVAGGGAFAATARGEPFGTELNARVSGKPLFACTLSARAATVWPGSAASLGALPPTTTTTGTAPAADAPQGAHPWTISLAVDWLLFSP